MLTIRKSLNPGPTMDEVIGYFRDHPEKIRIDQCNWINFPYQPEVSLKLAHTNREILLQYQVKEGSIRANYVLDNGNVWTDSCVEFFVSPIADGSYYNLEFNCIGTCLVGFGHGKPNRERGGLEVTGLIQRHATLGKSAIPLEEGNFEWTLTLIIPLEVFFKHGITSLSGMECRANFYKCGDELKQPHFLSWNPIQYEKPNFHLPEFFGAIRFE